MSKKKPIKIRLEEYDDCDYYLTIADRSLGLGKTIELRDLLLSICKSFNFYKQLCLSPYFSESIEMHEIFISKLFDADRAMLVKHLNERFMETTFEGRPLRLVVSTLSTKMKFKMFDLITFFLFFFLFMFFLLVFLR